MEKPSLTSLARAGGCGSKVGPQALRDALAKLPIQNNAKFIYGSGSGDDAGVYLLNDTLALIQTADFFTPIVDNPYDYGAIAAANALSDCFALGAQPITVLNILCSSKQLELSDLSQILLGAADKVAEAGAVTLGGHSVDDIEPKFGLAVTGTQDPKRLVFNNGAKPGEVLVLTKKIGTGVLTALAKKDPAFQADPAFQEAVNSMKFLNSAGLIMFEAGVTAATDVTGFGLLGHARNLAEASNVSIELETSCIPFFDKALENIESCIGGGAKRNREWCSGVTSFSNEVSESLRWLLVDPQTSGALLIVVPEVKLQGLRAACAEAGTLSFSVVGRVVERRESLLFVG